jgi:hypothetical protein
MEWGGSAGGRRLGGGGGRGGLSPGVVPLRVRGDGGRGRLGCLRLSRLPPIAPGSPTFIAPVVCSPPIWSPGGLAAAAGATGSLRNQSGIPEEVAVWAALAYLVARALAQIRHLRPVDAGVCASRCGDGAYDKKTLSGHPAPWSQVRG